MKRLRGSAALEARLLAIPNEVLAELRPALLKGAHDIADAMELLVPEDDGDLLGSIAVTGPNDTSPPYAAGGGSVTMKPNQAAVTVGNTDVRHGHLQEFGTVNHEAQPFMRPAFRLKRAKVMRRIATAVRKAIKKAGS
jgi:HK97 gp10 family phage protein